MTGAQSFAELAVAVAAETGDDPQALAAAAFARAERTAALLRQFLKDYPLRIFLVAGVSQTVLVSALAWPEFTKRWQAGQWPEFLVEGIHV